MISKKPIEIWGFFFDWTNSVTGIPEKKRQVIFICDGFFLELSLSGALLCLGRPVYI